MAAKEKASEEAEATPPSFITVKSNLATTRDGGNPTALWERHSSHVTPDNPDGEIFIAGGESVRVAKTSAVLKALSENRIVEVK